MEAADRAYVSRGGAKLAAAFGRFGVAVDGKVCADLGSNVGGFTDCLLRHGAARVYAIDTGYGVLDYRLRRDPRVVVLERTNALHVELPEPVDVVTIDLGWTRQRHALPAARRLLGASGRIVSLIKPQYEAEPDERGHGVLPPDVSERVIARVLAGIPSLGFAVLDTMVSPIEGQAGNREYLALLADAG
jgi:23S rRNA (cytidine1920-2'-O)/16S rRNA (cytidine1409-2'-O)-methyltransferase